MCCRRNQPQYLLQAGLPNQPRRLSKCAARRQERRELRALAVNSLPTLEKELGLEQSPSRSHWIEYQPRTMAGILVMGVALGLQEGGKKIKEKRDERKAKKAALAARLFAPAESSSGATRGSSTHRELRKEGKSEEVHRDRQRHSFSSQRIHEEDAPPSYDEVARPTYEEATRGDQRSV